MEIPKKIREELDKLYEADDNPTYVVDYKGQYLPKKGNFYTARHIHHIDKNRLNNELYNLIPLSYQDHIIEVHSKNNPEVKLAIYEFMVYQYPDYAEHYRKHLLQ